MGWMMGPIREWVLAPRLGPNPALLVEAAVLLVASVVAARWVARRFAHPYRLGGRMAIGGIALGFVIVAELTGGWFVRGKTPVEFLTATSPIAFALYFVFAAMPSLVERRTTTSPASQLPRSG